MDVFIEHLVKRKNTGKVAALRALVVLGTIVFCIIMFVLCTLVASISFIFLLLVAAGIYGAWWIMRTFRVEYEYIVTNGEMDVDKIIGQQKRKRLITINFKNIDIMAPMGGEHKHEFENQSIPKTVDASVSPTEPGAYFIVAHHEKQGYLRLIFNPDDRIIRSAKLVAPRKIFTD